MKESGDNCRDSKEDYYTGCVEWMWMKSVRPEVDKFCVGRIELETMRWGERKGASETESVRKERIGNAKTKRRRIEKRNSRIEDGWTVVSWDSCCCSSLLFLLFFCSFVSGLCLRLIPNSPFLSSFLISLASSLGSCFSPSPVVILLIILWLEHSTDISGSSSCSFLLLFLFFCLYHPHALSSSPRLVPFITGTFLLLFFVHYKYHPFSFYSSSGHEG